MPGTTVQEYLVLSQNVPLGTGSYYRKTVYARTRIECHRSPKKYTPEITAHPAGGRGVAGAIMLQLYKVGRRYLSTDLYDNWLYETIPP